MELLALHFVLRADEAAAERHARDEAGLLEPPLRGGALDFLLVLDIVVPQMERDAEALPAGAVADIVDVADNEGDEVVLPPPRRRVVARTTAARDGSGAEGARPADVLPVRRDASA